MSLKNFQYNKILREYDSRKFFNKHELDIRSKIALEKIPELKDIDNLIVSNSIKSARLLLSGDSHAIDNLRESNLELSAKKVELLVSNGFESDFLQMHYNCNDCKDTGYIGNVKCHCFKQAIVDLVYSQSNRKNILSIENFDSFSFDFYDNNYVDKSTNLTPLNNVQKVVSLCHNFINNFDSTYANILLYGNTGVGKTFLANCITKELLDTAHTVIYLTSFQFFDILEKNKFGKTNDKPEAEDQFEYILDCDLLIIDDLGTELNNAFITSQLYLCINERHLRRKSTIISTNLSWEDLKTNYSERIFSRITSDYTFLKIVGDDIRIKKAFSK